jgi:RNA polymerase sigma factor (sigma-70 family)
MSSQPNPEQPNPAPRAEPVTQSVGETQSLVRDAASSADAAAWPALSAKITAYLQSRFGRSSFPPGIEFHDFVHDLLAKVMTSIHSFEDRGKDSFWKWVQTIGGNLWRDMWRRHERDRKLGIVGRGSSDESGVGSGILSPVQAAEDDGPSASSILRFRELERAEQDCIQRLSKTMREVYVLRRQRELSFAEIAAEMGGIKEVTLRSNFMRARDQVRECLAHKVDEVGSKICSWKEPWG